MVIDYLKKNKYLFLIILLASFSLSPVLTASFLRNWDDNLQVLNNPDIQTLSFEFIKKYFSTFYVSSYQPLATLSFAIENYFFGLNPMVFHSTNLILHLINIFLVYQFLATLFKKQTHLVLLSTAVFALNPVQTETVAWVSARSTLMFSTFFLISCLFYIKYKNTDKIKNILYCFLFFLISLFCKSAALTLPIVLILIDFMDHKKNKLNNLLNKIPFVILSIVFGIISLKARNVLPGLKSDFDSYYTYFEHIILISYSFLFYIWKVLIPYPLNNFYEYPLKNSNGNLPIHYALAFYFLLIITLLGFVYRSKIKPYLSKELIFGILFYSLNIVFVVNIFSFTLTMVAERYFYLSIVGLALFFISLLKKFVDNIELKKSHQYLIYFIFLSYSICTYTQSLVWKNPETLWTHAIKYSQSSYPYLRYANYLHQLNRLDESLYYFNEGLKVNSKDLQLYEGRLSLLIDIGEYELALKDANTIIKSNTNDQLLRARVNFNLSQVYAKQNDFKNALSSIESVIHLFLQPEKLNFSLLKEKADDNESQNEIEKKSLVLNEVVNERVNNIKSAAKDFFEKKDFKQTIVQCETILLFNDSSLEAHLLLAQTYFELKQTQKVIDEYNTIIKILKKSY